MSDIVTLIWKEWKENILGGGFKGLLSVLASLAVFGIVLPMQFGAEMLESPTTMLLWSWIPLFSTATIIADAFAGERERHTLETLFASRLSNKSILLGKTLASALYGYLMMLASLALGTLSINMITNKDGLVLMSPTMAVGVTTIGFLACWLTATIGVHASMRSATVKQAQQVMLTAITVIIFGGIFGIQLLPEKMITEIGIALASYTSIQLTTLVVGALTVLSLLTTAFAVKTFRRTKAII